MNRNLKTLVLALAAGLVFTVCADEPACPPKMDAPAAATAAAAPAPASSEKQAKPRRTRRVKKEKSAAPAEGKQKTPRCRRTRKMDAASLPVTGMLDSAE